MTQPTTLADQRAKAYRYRLARAGVALMWFALMLLLIASGACYAGSQHSELHPYFTGAFFAILTTIAVTMAAAGILTLMANAADPDKQSESTG